MPYQKKDELPEAVKGLPEHGQEIWMAAFNSAWDQYKGDEEKCFATAWAAVEKKYKKEGDKWIEMKDNLLAFIVLKEVDKDAPSEFQLLPQGKIEIEGDLPAFVDEESARLILNYQARRGNDMVIDYEHQTLKDVQAPAAGWIKKMIDKGKDGIWVVTDWTKRAREYLVNKEYRFFSPVILVRPSDRKVVAVMNVALTNFPKINNLQPIISKLESEAMLEDENRIKKRKEEIMITNLRKLLKLADDATDEKVLEAVMAIVAKLTTFESAPVPIACKEILEAVGAKEDAKKEEILVLIASMKVPTDVAKTLSLEVADLRKQLSEIKQNDLITLALKDGKTSPEELDKWARDLALKNPEQFKVIVLSRPAGTVIPIGGIPPGPSARDGSLNEVQLSINKMLGINKETWEKYNKTA